MFQNWSKYKYLWERLTCGCIRLSMGKQLKNSPNWVNFQNWLKTIPKVVKTHKRNAPSSILEVSVKYLPPFRNAIFGRQFWSVNPFDMTLVCFETPMSYFTIVIFKLWRAYMAESTLAGSQLGAACHRLTITYAPNLWHHFHCYQKIKVDSTGSKWNICSYAFHTVQGSRYI